jgi:pilus assembly protein CpaF
MTEAASNIIRMKQWMVERLQGYVDPLTIPDRSPETLRMLSMRFSELCHQSQIQLPDEQARQIFMEVANDIVGYGPLEPLLLDDNVTEVMANGVDKIYVERQGKIVLTQACFDDEAHMMRIINRIIKPLGRTVDRGWPMVDARLPDGSRVNAIIPPSAVDGPSITIRKFARTPFTVDDLINFGSLTMEMAEFLKACVVSRLNIVVSGGTGSGKTTLLNVLSSFIPEDERIITIEDAAELQLHQTHVVRLETKPADPEIPDSKPVAIRDLVRNSLRMRPERIVVGECRGGEALDMLQAMNTGHDGSLTTIHANTPRDTIARLETLTLMAGVELPLVVVRRQIVSAVDVIVQIARLRDGSRKVTAITEVQGMEGDTITMQNIFEFQEEGERDGRVIGKMEPCGTRPRFEPRLKARGFEFSASMFMKEVPSPMAPRRRR